MNLFKTLRVFLFVCFLYVCVIKFFSVVQWSSLDFADKDTPAATTNQAIFFPPETLFLFVALAVLELTL